MSFAGQTPNSNVMYQNGSQPTQTPANNNVQSFQAQLNDQYNGPSSAEGNANYQNQQATVNNAIATGQQLQGTEVGNQQLIGQTEKVNSPSTTGLNEAILYSDPNATGQVQHAFDPFSNLSTQLTQGAGNIDTNIAGAQNQAQEASTQANQQIQNQLSGLNTQVGNENTAAFNNANTNFQGITNAFNSLDPNAKEQADIATVNANQGNAADRNALNADIAGTPTAANSGLTADQLSSLGLTQDQLQSLIGQQNQLAGTSFVASPNSGNGSAWTQAGAAPISQFLSGSAPTQSEFNSATAGDLATGNALNTLAGSNIFTAPTGGNTYTAPTFNLGAANTDYGQAVQAQQQAALNQANGIAASQQAQHQASEGGGLLGKLTGALPWIANAPLQLGKTSLQWAQKQGGK